MMNGCNGCKKRKTQPSTVEHDQKQSSKRLNNSLKMYVKKSIESKNTILPKFREKDSKKEEFEESEPKSWVEMSNYNDYLSLEIKWCFDRIMLAYNVQSNNNRGEENRCEIIWLCSFLVKLLKDVSPDTSKYIKKELCNLEIHEKNEHRTNVKCSHLYVTAYENMNERFHVSKNLEELKNKQEIVENTNKANTCRDSVVLFMNEGILSQSHQVSNKKPSVDMEWIANQYKISVKQYKKEEYRFPNNTLVSQVRAQRAYFLLHYPILVLNMGTSVMGDVDTEFLQPIFNNWFKFLTSSENHWKYNFELLAEVILCIILCKKYESNYQLPEHFENIIFLIQQTIVSQFGNRRDAKLGNLSVYFFKINRNSGYKIHQSYHTNVLVALFMSNYITWKNEQTFTEKVSKIPQQVTNNDHSN